MAIKEIKKEKNYKNQVIALYHDNYKKTYYVKNKDTSFSDFIGYLFKTKDKALKFYKSQL